MKRDPLKATVLATKLIPNVNEEMARQLNLTPTKVLRVKLLRIAMT